MVVTEIAPKMPAQVASAATHRILTVTVQTCDLGRSIGSALNEREV